VDAHALSRRAQVRGTICPDPPGRGRSGGPAAGGSRPLRSARSRL